MKFEFAMKNMPDLPVGTNLTFKKGECKKFISSTTNSMCGGGRDTAFVDSNHHWTCFNQF